jgi:hypothetical protein
MKVHHRCSPEAIEAAISERVVDDVTRALCSIVTQDDRFVVNDSEWFIRRGKGGVTPCVMNAAKFLSQTFQTVLKETCGWEKEKQIAGQVIDAYVELSGAGRKLRVPADLRFVDFFQKWCSVVKPEDLRKEFLSCWRRFVQIGVNRSSEIGKPYRQFFQESGTGTATVRIGLEFETGNIASSFRALDKLETLFVTGLIDYGVFVTSIDKEHAAARIWPTSNRNRSFAELEKRNYRNNRTVPLWEFGFEPDEFDQSAPFFDNTILYEPIPTGRTVKQAGVLYEVFRRGGEKLLRRAIAPQNRRSDAP